MKGLRTILVAALLCLAATAALGGETVTLQKAQGEVMLRAGVTESWTRAIPGEALSPDATVRTGKQSSATLFIPSKAKKITLPPEVMVDISDIRELTQEELMLKLTMEKVRATSYEWKNKELRMPNTTVVHGSSKAGGEEAPDADSRQGVLELNGARVLYDNSFYSTSALKSLDVLRRFPALDGFENRMLIAQALEKAELKGEAINEYSSILLFPELTKDQKTAIQGRIARLRGGK